MVLVRLLISSRLRQKFLGSQKLNVDFQLHRARAERLASLTPELFKSQLYFVSYPHDSDIKLRNNMVLRWIFLQSKGKYRDGIMREMELYLH